MERKYQICKRCVMDTTDPDIVFDKEGFCNHCTKAIKKLRKYQFKNEKERQTKINEIVSKIKKKGKGKQYDCIIGLSGGIDSSYLAYFIKELGLRPLAVHVDNGWNSELAVNNIENIVKKLDIDLYTYVIDWEEFKDLQIAFLRSSVVDLEMLSDNAIVIGIYSVAKKYKIKYFISGSNVATETCIPSSWFFGQKHDSLNIKSIYKKFGNGRKLKSYPLLNFFQYLKYTYFGDSTSVVKSDISLLNYISYDKNKVKNLLINKLDWRDYGGKHGESKITAFYQQYILPNKFSIDKRKSHLSSLICSGQITRDNAIKEINKPLYESKKIEEELEYFLKKLELTREEFDKIMKLPISDHFDFPSYNKWHKNLAFIKDKISNFL